MGEIKRIFCDY